MKKGLTTLLVVLSSYLFGQGFTYSYVDPCSKQVKTLQVTNTQAITVNYLGNIGSFSSNDFLNGVFDAWVNQITATAADQPCDELLTNTQVSQNMFVTQNLISTLTSVTAASTMTASNAVSNSVSNSSSSGRSNRRGGNTNNSSSNNQSNTSSDGTSNNSQGNISTNATTPSGGTQQGGSASSSSSTIGGNNTQGGTNNQSGNVSQGGSGTSQRSVNPTGQNTNQSGTGSNSNSVQGQNQGQSQGQVGSDGKPKQSESGGTGGTTNSISNAAEATSSGSGGKGSKPNVGSIIGTGDIVAIRVNEDKSNQFRGTMSVTKSNTNNTKAKGFLLNYTTSVRNSNLTLYGAFNNKKRTNTFIMANSSMIDLTRNFFNTTTALESKKIGKTSLMAGLNLTIGGMGGEMFTNLSAVGGGFHPFKVSKNLSGNILLLGVYSPFTKFYDGKWWDSGWLVVPFSSWDYAISKNFKYNVSLSGTYEVKGSILQFQILTGGKILL
jgi:hypothetical protein